MKDVSTQDVHYKNKIALKVLNYKKYIDFKGVQYDK